MKRDSGFKCHNCSRSCQWAGNKLLEMTAAGPGYDNPSFIICWSVRDVGFVVLIFLIIKPMEKFNHALWMVNAGRN